MQLEGQKKLSRLLTEYMKVTKSIEQSTAALTATAFSHLTGFASDRAVGDFQYADAERFQASLIDAGLGKVSANIYIKSIRPVFSWALKHQLIESNPFDGLKMYRVAQKRIRTFEPWEIRVILDACPDELWRARVLLGKMSLRRGEVLNLTVDDIDFANEILYITAKDDTRHTWSWQPKNKQTGELPMTPQLARILVKLLNELPAGQPYLLIKPQRYQRLMEMKRRGRLLERFRKKPVNNFDREFKRILNRAGVTGSFHDLRRTAITEWAQILQPHELKEIARHSDLKTTLTYYVARRKRAAIKKAYQVSIGGAGSPERNRNCRTQTISIGATGLEPATS